MVREQAEKVWEEREATWASEREASNKLLADVLAYREQQIAAKREQNLAKQQQLIADREDLLAHIEHIASETARDQLKRTAEQQLAKTEREDELEYRKTQRDDEAAMEELAEAERVQAHQIYNNTVAEEKARLLGEVYKERAHSKPSSRPGTSHSVVRFEEPEERYSESRPHTASSFRPRTADSGVSSFSRITGPFIY